eukprot:scaffold44439_cov40-Phaeocystis_antarctica.AAC.3
MLTRHWIFTDATGKVTEMKGPGARGVTPVLRPGDSWQYESGTRLDTNPHPHPHPNPNSNPNPHPHPNPNSNSNPNPNQARASTRAPARCTAPSSWRRFKA